MFGEGISSVPLVIMHIVWLALIIFLLSLVKRLVNAVEKIAENIIGKQ